MFNSEKSRFHSAKKIFTVFIAFLILYLTLKIENCPAQWIYQYTVTDYQLLSGAVADANTAFLTGFDMLTHKYTINLKTTNGGSNWSQILSNSEGGFCVYFLNSLTGFLSGLISATSVGILRTTNAGMNWYTVYTPSDTDIVMAMSFINASTGFGAGSLINYNGPYAGTLVKTTNLGVNWTKLPWSIPLITEMTCCNFIDDNTGFVGGKVKVMTRDYSYGVLLKTVNGGQNWVTVINTYNILINNGDPVRSVQFINSVTGYTTFNSYSADLIWKSTNSGNNWFAVYNNGNIHGVGGLVFVNSNTGYVAADTGIVLKTTDSGNSWTTQFTGIYDEIRNVMFYDVNTGWAIAKNKILHTTNGGSVWINKINTGIPERFNLYQNFPNPFNPATKIKFDIRSEEIATLQVFDALGREVEILLSGKLTPGTYETEWNGINHPSGVYFYKLTTGNFADTKRMILIK